MTEKPVKKNPNAPTSETVLAVKHFTDKTFSFSLTRPASFRFRSGEFIMIGLMGEVKGQDQADFAGLFYRQSVMGREAGFLFDQGR